MRNKTNPLATELRLAAAAYALAVVVNEQNTVTNLISGAQQFFYRLSSP